MMLPWMLYTLLVGTLVGAAALGLERCCALLRWPTRWAWAGALALTLALAATAAGRVAPLSLAGVSWAEAGEAARPSAANGPSLPESVVERVREALRAGTAVPLERAAVVVERLSGGGWSRALGVGWAGLSVLALLGLGGAALRHRGERRRYPIARLHGTAVRISPDFGPAATGLLRHEIIVPRWLLAVPAEEQRLILTHETEHCRARDPLLLAAGWLAVALVPWHPVVWWMASRLRLATEVDCDARVLRRGVRPLVYGSLLIAIAGRCSGTRVGASALADSQSHLERRLRAMIPGSGRFPLARAVSLGGLAVATLLAACEASVPTASEIEAMDVAAVERGAGQLRLRSPLGDPGVDASYFVDGAAVDAAAARAIEPERIASIEVVRTNGAEDRSEVRIVTREAAAAAGADVLALREPGAPGPLMRERLDLEGENGVAPLILINGERSDAAALRALMAAGTGVVSVEVVKGEPAIAQYGADAAGGVISVTTGE